MTPAEKETVIRWDQERRMVSLYTCSKALMRQAEAAGWPMTREWRNSGRVVSREYEAPKKQMRLSLVSREKLAADAARMGPRLRAMNQARKLSRGRVSRAPETNVVEAGPE